MQTCLFLSSYLPLFVLVGVRSVGKTTIIAVGCGILAVAAVVGTAVFLKTAYRRNTIDVYLTAVESRDADVAAYLATYLLPFVTVFTGRWQDVVSLAGFILVLGIIYVRSRLIYINPTLALLGYHVTRVIPATPGSEHEDRVRWPRYVLAHGRHLTARETVRAHEVTPDLLILEKQNGARATAGPSSSPQTRAQ